MPGIVMFKRRWSVGSDDMVIGAVFLALLHLVWLVVLSLVLGMVHVDQNTDCSLDLRNHILGYLVILVVCVLIEAALAWLSMRGSILNTKPRDSVQYLLYVRLGVLAVELIWLVVGLSWFIQHYKTCPASSARRAILGVIVCNWIIMVCVLLAAWCTFDTAGRSWVKLKKQQAGNRYEYRGGHRRTIGGNGRHGWRHRMSSVTSIDHLRRKAVRLYEESWLRRFRLIFCCMKDDRKESFVEVAKMMSDFFVDIDVVPSDIVAGLMLMRRQQKTRQAFIVSQETDAVYEFLSGVPITPQTRFVSVHNTDTRMWYTRVVRYMRYALAAYGWPMYLLSNSATGLCTILPSLRCCCGCSCGDQPLPQSPLVEDNCCACNFAALLKITGLKELDISYVTYHVDVDETPFYIALDHVERSVVLAIRGTQSLKDILTDLKADAEVLPIDPPNEHWLGHKGMVFTAEYIKKKIDDERLLEKAFQKDVERGTPNYQLVLVGHSLGAGTAAILAILLRQRYPNLHCYAYAPPGGLLSATCVKETKSFITSVVVGKDVVPRIGLYQMEALRQDLLNLLKRSDEPKWKIIGGSMVCCQCPGSSGTPTLLEDAESVACWRTYRDSGRFQNPVDSQVGLSSHLPLFLPGNIVHVVRNHPKKTRRPCAVTQPLYQAIWADQTDFDEVIISPVMLADHMPDNMLRSMEKVLTKVSPAKPERRPVESCTHADSSFTVDCIDGPSQANSLTWDYCALGGGLGASLLAGIAIGGGEPLNRTAPLASPETVSFGSTSDVSRLYASQPAMNQSIVTPPVKFSRSISTPFAHSTPMKRSPERHAPRRNLLSDMNASSVPMIPNAGDTAARAISEQYLHQVAFIDEQANDDQKL